MSVMGSAVQSEAEARKIELLFDIVVIPIVFVVLIAAFHIHVMLTVGDWDFWTDWKDRRWWPTITPISLITFPAAVQWILWEKFRIPLGATLCLAGLLVGTWISRITNFHMWSYYPLNFVWPATFLPMALVLDTVLVISRSYLMTAIFGGLLFSLVFYPSNWALLAPYHVPVEKDGVLMTLADLQGYTYVRTGTPEYIRKIEEGTLRTFGEDVTPVSAFFGGFIAIIMYYLWTFMGRLFSTTAFLKRI
jgi:methane/ammonia monooxygenase subunit A